eukprot:2374869-Prymnesium_polylepis.1
MIRQEDPLLVSCMCAWITSSGSCGPWPMVGQRLSLTRALYPSPEPDPMVPLRSGLAFVSCCVSLVCAAEGAQRSTTCGREATGSGRVRLLAPTLLSNCGQPPTRPKIELRGYLRSLAVRGTTDVRQRSDVRPIVHVARSSLAHG